MSTDQNKSRFPFLRLPPEIQHAVCAELCVHCNYSGWDLSIEYFQETQGWPWSYRDLARLSRTSRALRALAQPLLYHVFPSRNCGRFLRTIFERPDLASGVKIFRGFGSNYNHCEAYNVSLAHMYTGHADEAQCYIGVGRALDLGDEHLSIEYIFWFKRRGLKTTPEESQLFFTCTSWTLFRTIRQAHHILHFCAVSEPSARLHTGIVINRRAREHSSPLLSVYGCAPE